MHSNAVEESKTCSSSSAKKFKRLERSAEDRILENENSRWEVAKYLIFGNDNASRMCNARY